MNVRSACWFSNVRTYDRMYCTNTMNYKLFFISNLIKVKSKSNIRHVMTIATNKKRICVIGAGPCGMAALYHLVNNLSECNTDIVCFEKQSTWGGQWNLQMNTGTDEHGESCHSGMYKHLWSNGPKECLEFPDYTFEQHFGKVLPSFVPRAVLRDYLEGKWTQNEIDLQKFVRFDTSVRNVAYNDSDETFHVTTKDLRENDTTTHSFSHVIVATGRYSCPNIPTFPGMESFKGRIIHAHDFRDPADFKDQRILLVGSSFSAEDIALLCWKFGAKSIKISWKSQPTGHKWPSGIIEHPLIQKIDTNTVEFTDGASAEIDAIILCTGYLTTFPFMEERLAVKTTRSSFADGLYKGLVWTRGGANNLFYMGIHSILHSFPMYDLQGLWICKYIMDTIPDEPTPLPQMLEEVEQQSMKISKLLTIYDSLDYQVTLFSRLCKDVGYTTQILECDGIFRTWKHQKDANIMTCRDQCFKSIFTGNMAAKPIVPWWNSFDDCTVGCKSRG